MRSRIRTGSVVQDKRDKKWTFYWWEGGRRRSRRLGQFSTKAAAWSAAKPLRDALEQVSEDASSAPTISSLIEGYRAERMPTRADTKRSYEVWISNYITPQWGNCAITDLQPRPVELWLASLSLAPKSRTHIRGVLRNLWDIM